MSWPLPTKLRRLSEAGPLAPIKVEVQLLNGQLIEGLMSAGESLSEISVLTLMAHGQPVTVPVAAIRSVTRLEVLALQQGADTAPVSAPSSRMKKR